MAIDLTHVLKGYRAGRWVVLNHKMTKVIASGRTSAEARDRAAKKRSKNEPPGSLLKIPDPKTVSVY